MLNPLRLGILSSHGGSLLQLVIDACQSRKLNATVELMIGNNSGSLAYIRAIKAGITSKHISSSAYPSAESLDEAILEALLAQEVNFVLLAGYMRIIGPKTLRHFEGKIINTHPSLLPKFGGKGFYGRRVHEAVFAAGETETGATVHYVSAKYDEGQIIAQAKVAVMPEDTAEDIERRVQIAERQLLLQTLDDISKHSV